MNGDSIDRTSNVVTCNCADTPPTMPTYRKHHLPICPVWALENAGYVTDEVKESITVHASNEQSRGDTPNPRWPDGTPIETAVLQREWKAQRAEIERLAKENRELAAVVSREAKHNCELASELERLNGDSPCAHETTALRRYRLGVGESCMGDSYPKLIEDPNGEFVRFADLRSQLKAKGDVP